MLFPGNHVLSYFLFAFKNSSGLGNNVLDSMYSTMCLKLVRQMAKSRWKEC